jgi:hypothetical protein
MISLSAAEVAHLGTWIAQIAAKAFGRLISASLGGGLRPST